MALCLLSCGILQQELEKIVAEGALKTEEDLKISYVPSALHVDYDKLKSSILQGLEENRGNKTMLLFGNMCHPEMEEFTCLYDTKCSQACNCIEMFLPPERKKELDGEGQTFFLTSGWLKNWHDIFQSGQGWDEIDARQNMGFYDRILLLDTGVEPINDEDLLEFFEFTQVPIEIESMNLDYFKKTINKMLQENK